MEDGTDDEDDTEDNVGDHEHLRASAGGPKAGTYLISPASDVAD
jgi:hypothetical protein